MVEIIQTMTAWAGNVFDQIGFGPAALPLALLLGLLSALSSACCTLPVFGAIVGYSGTRRNEDRRAILSSAASFMLGTIVALMVLGSAAGFVGQLAQSSLGKYWKIFAGVIAILAGIATLDLLPFKLPAMTPKGNPRRGGIFAAGLFGFVLGGGVAVCSLPCNPGIFIILGVAVLQKHVLWAIATLAAYAIGFSAPLAALILGVSFGKAAVKAKSAEKIVRIAAGIILIVAGFYFLSSL